MGQGEAPGAGGLVRVGAGVQGWKQAGTRGREAGDTSLPGDAGRPHRAASGGEPECGGRAQGPDPILQSLHTQTLLWPRAGFRNKAIRIFKQEVPSGWGQTCVSPQGLLPVRGSPPNPLLQDTGPTGSGAPATSLTSVRTLS